MSTQLIIQQKSTSRLIRASVITGLLLGLGLFIFSHHSSAKTTFTVGAYNNEPIIFTGDDGVVRGLFIDILEDIAKKEGWQLEYKTGSISELLQDLQAGRIDLLPAIAYSKAKEQDIDYNLESVLSNWAEIYSPAHRTISSILDLQGKKIAVKQGDIHFLNLRRLTENLNLACRFFEADEYQTVFEMVQANYVDLAAVNRLYGNRNKTRYGLTQTQIIFSPVELRYAVPEKQNIQIIGALDSHLRKFKTDQTSIYYQAINRWLVVKTEGKNPQWMLGTLYIAVGIALFLSATVLFIQNQVRKQTRQLQKTNQALQSQIEERSKTEETLQKFERIVEASSDAMALLDNNHRHILANSTYVKTIGHNDANLEGKELKTVVGTDFYEKELQNGIQRCLQGQVIHVQSRPSRENTNNRYWNITLNPFYTIRDTLNGYVINIRDVTEQVELQTRLKNSQKMEAIGMLAGGVAHDLNNILSGLVSYPDLLLLKRDPDDPMTKPLQTIKKSGERAAAIVQELLTLARRGGGTPAPVNLNSIVREFLASPGYNEITKSIKNIEYDIKLDSNLANVHGTTIHLSKLVLNLFTNAVEAMGNGGKLTIGTENVILTGEKIGYEVIPPGEYATLFVSDTGSGMATPELNRVFEPFYTSKIMGRRGTGLGMAVVWGAMKDHDGYIDILTSLGKGTTFIAYFPITHATVQSGEIPLLDDYVGNNEKILVIDDLEEQLVLTSTMVKQLGYSADVASSGEEAVELCRRKKYDLLILDMIMPGGMDGYATYEKILSIRPEQRAIIASGYSESSRVKKAQELGAGAYIKKPYTIEVMAKAIRQELMT